MISIGHGLSTGIEGCTWTAVFGCCCVCRGALGSAPASRTSAGAGGSICCFSSSITKLNFPPLSVRNSPMVSPIYPLNHSQRNSKFNICSLFRAIRIVWIRSQQTRVSGLSGRLRRKISRKKKERRRVGIKSKKWNLRRRWRRIGRGEVRVNLGHGLIWEGGGVGRGRRSSWPTPEVRLVSFRNNFLNSRMDRLTL